MPQRMVRFARPQLQSVVKRGNQQTWQIQDEQAAPPSQFIHEVVTLPPAGFACTAMLPAAEVATVSVETVTSLPQPLVAVVESQVSNELRLCGKYWEVRFDDDHGIVEDCRGLRYIAILIRDAGAGKGPIHAKELVARATNQDETPVELESPDYILDDRARRQLAERVQELGLARSRAAALDDFDRMAALDDEYERIVEELGRAQSSKDRRHGAAFNHASERARKAVAKAISDAIGRVAANPKLAHLAQHLSTSIHKGSWLSYAATEAWIIDLATPLPRK